MNNNPFNNDLDHCAISYQLLQLLKWLFEHEQEALKQMVLHAVKGGLDEEVLFRPIDAQDSDEELQQSIMAFFSLMEALLYEAMHEDKAQKMSTLIPTIKNIDVAACDDALIEMSAVKATHALEKNPYADPKKLLCKELLKHWKPFKLEMH